MKDLIFNVIFFVTMLQMGATAVIMCFFEDSVMKMANDDDGLAAYERFINEFGPDNDATRESFRKQLALMHYMEGFVCGIIVIGMFLFGNYRIGHLYGAIGCAGFASVNKTVINMISTYPQINGNEAMIKNKDGINMFIILAVANFVAFVLSNKSFFPTSEDCNNDNDNGKTNDKDKKEK